MTGESPAAAAGADAASALAAVHGGDLHHLASMLTGSTDTATALVVRTLRSAEAEAGGPGLQADLVRLFLRTAPRRRERAEPGRARDAGDVLRSLAPRARAAAALRLVQEWDVASVARAVGVSPRRVEALVPATPGLAVALAAVADQHSLGPAALQRELAEELRAASPPRAGRPPRWRWWALAAVPLAVLVGWAAVAGGPGDREDAATLSAGPDGGTRPDLSAVGLVLDEDGDPPRAAMGLTLSKVLTLQAGSPQRVSWPSPMNAHASFAVLWCDMPPASDANLRVPSATLTLDAEEIALPCSGRKGPPPVTGLVPLPPGGFGQLRLEGDLPPGGGATLAIYEEAASLDTPLARGSLVEPPPAPAGSVVLDPGDTEPAPDYGLERRVLRPATLEVGHESTIRVWVGRTGAVSVNVDGVAATDDGDVSLAHEWVIHGGGSEGSSPDQPDWRTQRPDLRWGTWLAWVPGEVRTFDLPDLVRPAPGQRATVTLEVMAENTQEHVQVAVLDARRAQVDTSAVPAEASAEAPELLGPRRLVGAWVLPRDGIRRELAGAPTTGPLEAVGLVLDAVPEETVWRPSGVVERDGQAAEAVFESDLGSALETLQGGWLPPVPEGDGPLRASAPATPGGRSALLLLYQPLAYEDVDFTRGGVPPGSWRPGEEPPPQARYRGVEPLAVIGPDDVEDGSTTLELPDTAPLAARITTEGRGRIRFQIDGYAADALWTSQGWWSSWTDQAVVTEVDLSYAEGMGQRELSIEVEDYEEFTVEVLAPALPRP